jgi:hypothetical protein
MDSTAGHPLVLKMVHVISCVENICPTLSLLDQTQKKEQDYGANGRDDQNGRRDRLLRAFASKLILP